MVIAMMKQIMKDVTMMVVIAVETVSTQNFASNVYVRKKANQQLTFHVIKLLHNYDTQTTFFLNAAFHSTRN